MKAKYSLLIHYSCCWAPFKEGTLHITVAMGRDRVYGGRGCVPPNFCDQFRQGGQNIVCPPQYFVIKNNELVQNFMVIQGVHKVLHTLKIFISQKPHKVETLHFRQ